MKSNFGNLFALVSNLHEKSPAFFAVLSDRNDLDLKVSESSITLRNDKGTVILSSQFEGRTIFIQCSNLVDSSIIINDAVSALSFALYRLGIQLDPEDEEIARVIPTGYPVLPKPAATYADHSYPAFTKEQMLIYARDSVVRFTGMAPFEVDSTVESYDDMYKDFGVEWCETCGGQVGDDCSCNDGECGEDDEDEVCPHCNSESCQCPPDCDHCGRASCDCDVEQ